MGKTQLVDKDIEDGKKLIEALDRSSFPVTGALWFYITDSDEWRLLLVSPLVAERGPKSTYALIQSVMAKLEPPLGILLKRISVLSPKNELIQLLRMAIVTGPGISEIRFTGNTINNVFIEDALIYRLSK
jgi:hypothetical protein